LKIPSVDDSHLRENQTALGIGEACKIFRRHFPRNVPERPSAAGVWEGRSPPIQTLETFVEGFSNLPLTRRQGKYPSKLVSSSPTRPKMILKA